MQPVCLMACFSYLTVATSRIVMYVPLSDCCVSIAIGAMLQCLLLSLNQITADNGPQLQV